jgi:hypothetical protein
MNKLLLLVLFIALLTFRTSAQSHTEIIKRAAQLMANAIVNEDYSTAVGFYYPKLVEAQGGKDSVIDETETYLKGKNSDGKEFKIKNVTIGEPGEEIKIDSILYSVIPEKLVLRINGANYEKGGSLIGISADNGKHWWFEDSAGLEELEEFLPNIAKLNIPKATMLLKLKDK